MTTVVFSQRITWTSRITLQRSQFNQFIFNFNCNSRAVFNCVSKVIRNCLGLAILRSMIGLKKTRATYSTNQVQNQTQSRLGHIRFPALGAGYVSHWFIVLFAFLVIALVFVLRHSNENQCNCIEFI